MDNGLPNVDASGGSASSVQEPALDSTSVAREPECLLCRREAAAALAGINADGMLAPPIGPFGPMFPTGRVAGAAAAPRGANPNFHVIVGTEQLVCFYLCVFGGFASADSECALSSARRRLP